MSKRNIKANFIQKNNIIYDNGKINQNQNKFPNQLNSKSVFMIAKDGIMIDFNGDGIYDKKINLVKWTVAKSILMYRQTSTIIQNKLFRSNHLLLQ